MNKIIIIVSAIISLFFLNAGYSYFRQASDFQEQKEKKQTENYSLIQDLTAKDSLAKSQPVEMKKAFNLFINLKHMLENYGNTKMDFVFISKNGSDSLQDYFIDSDFKNVKELPIDLKISKLSKDIDTFSVLRDIYMLEKETEFKIDQIKSDNDTFEVKGEIYGI